MKLGTESAVQGPLLRYAQEAALGEVGKPLMRGAGAPTTRDAPPRYWLPPPLGPRTSLGR